MVKRSKSTGVLMHVTTAALACWAQSVAAQADAEGGDQTAATAPGGEIVVTGERRDQTLLKTVSSVAVIDQDALRRSTGKDLFNLPIANVTIAEGERIPNIRGVQSNGPGQGGSTFISGVLPRATIFIDDVARPFQYANYSGLSLWDVEQVEVYRGPQNTLRGRASIAGAFVVNTKDPTFKPEAIVGADFLHDGINGDDYRVAAAVAGPLIADTVAFRLAAEYFTGDTFQRPVGAVAQANPDVDVTGQELVRLRGKLLVMPASTPWLSVLGFVEYEEGQTPVFRNYVSSPISTGQPYNRRAYLVDFPRIVDVQSVAAGLESRADLGASNILLLLNYARGQFNTEDKAVAVADVVFDDVVEEIFEQEAIVSFGSASGPNGLAGIAFLQRDGTQQTSGFFPSTGGLKTRSQAIFADLTFPVGNIELMAGGRIQNQRDVRQTAAFGFLNLDVDQEETVALPSLGARYNFSNDHNLSVMLKRGWSAGGGGVNFANFTAYEFTSEFVWNYEMSYRGSIADGRVFVAANVFYNDHKDQQFFIQGPLGPADLAIQNVPSSESYGAELEIATNVSSTWKASLGIGVLHTEITKAPAGEPGRKGNRFPLAPSFSANARTSAEILKGVTADGSISYVGSYWSTEGNIPGTRAGDYALADVGVTWDLGEFSARVFVNNVFDALAFQARLDTAGNVTLAQPRTIGVSLRWGI